MAPDGRQADSLRDQKLRARPVTDHKFRTWTPRTWPAHSPLTIQACFQIAWAGSVTIGALGGSFIPDSVVGLDFALTAFFMVLCIDMCRNRKNVPVPLVALGRAVVGNLFFGEGMLVAAMLLFVTFLLARYAVLTVVTRRA